jgi:hypothetical protein
VTDTPKRWTRLLVEFGVIVVGVLVALGLEASWGQMQDRAREGELLADLAEEFAENEVRLRTDLTRNDSVVARLDAWHSIVSARSSVSPDSIALLLDGSLYLSRFDPLTGVLNGIIETGELALVRDVTLRNELAGWQGKVEEARITALDVQAYRSSVMSEVFDVVHGSGTPARHETTLRSLQAFSEIAVRQQRALLIDISEIRELLTGSEG